ncbi:hypothetical protein Tco_0570545 [Tanacetum coccineum]
MKDSGVSWLPLTKGHRRLKINTPNDIEIELNEKFWVELRKNIYQGTYNEDMVEHIAKISEGDGKITTWEELVEKFFCRFYPESYDGEGEMLDEGENWGIDPLEFLSPYDVRNIEKENEQGQTKRKDNNNDDKQPNKRRCKAEKFEAIQYSIGPNEEYIAVRRPREGNIDEYWWRIYKSGNLEVLES